VLGRRVGINTKSSNRTGCTLRKKMRKRSLFILCSLTLICLLGFKKLSLSFVTMPNGSNKISNEITTPVLEFQPKMVIRLE